MKLSRIIFLLIAAVIVIAVAWYLISPAFRVVELNEPIIMDRMDTMNDAEKSDFDRAVTDAQNDTNQMDEPMNEQVVTVAQGEFRARAHDVEGTAKLLTTNGDTVLRFEDFDTINGPDLHVYLASELGDTDYIDLGKLKATRGNFNYELDPAIDTDKYNKVLVWCVPFGVLFSYAELQ